MKDKNKAGLLALFLGAFGAHRFYLGQRGKGIFLFIMGMIAFNSGWLLMLAGLVALIDGIGLLSMDDQKFNDKYNRFSQPAPPPRERPDFHREERRQSPPARPSQKPADRPNPHKEKGLEKFKTYDYAEAIEEFKKSLDIAPHDVATHFNMACAYSLMEESEKAFFHLDKAVAFGFRDFQKIKEHRALAYLRIQSGFETFEKNGFRSPQSTHTRKEDNLLASQPDLLDQLKKLGEMREKGMLTEREFEDQKRKLLR